MKHQKNRSRTRQKTSFKDYAGTEDSPYNRWLIAKGDYKQEHEAAEPLEANPDGLAETDSLYHVESHANEEQLEMVRKALPYLTHRQKQVLQMVGYEGKTMENCGAILGISKGNVLDILKRARKIIKQKGK